MSPATTPLRPASESTPLAIINTRIHAAKRLLRNIDAANSTESGKKKSQARMSRAYTTEGHANGKTSDSHGRPANSGWRLRVKTQKCTTDVTPASKPMKTKEVKVSVLA